MSDDLRDAVNAIKALAMDAVQAANSGHPGAPMGLADAAAVLWTRFLTVDPDDPTWPDRDRFILSNGHGSMLLYSLLHLSGFPMPMDELRNFRQWGSHTAGHPEVDQALGIETTTGPLGQGFATGVGMAMAEAHLRARFGPDLVDHRVFGFVSDGDLMEGISQEAASLAGHLGLGRIVYLYDANRISIDGSTDITYSEDVAAKYTAMGWHTLTIDGHDHAAIAEAYEAAIAADDRPSLIIAHTHIGHGSPGKQDSASAHGSPLGDDEIAATREAIGWDHPPFEVPASIYETFTTAMERGRAAHRAWQDRRGAAFAAEPELAEAWAAHHDQGRVTLAPPAFDAVLATRAAGGALFDQIAERVPGFLGGAADLAESTKTVISDGGSFSADDPGGRNVHFGIREHAMGAAVNGMNLHGGVRAYGATFLIFSDYMRAAVRLSALMAVPSIWVWTHDSVFLGEDGPTHQPIEHLASLRAMPGLWVVRPADATETVEAWELALNRHDGPTALVLTRQGVPTLDRPRGGVARGGYVLRPGNDVTLVATGSEVATCLDAADLLAGDGVDARVVSLPCWEAFEAEDEAYRREVLGTAPRLAVEAAASFGWERWADETHCIDRFGASAPAGVIAEHLGFTAEAIARHATELAG
ncbi:MAG: transketolase [Acidimicrobiia bacterium]